MKTRVLALACVLVVAGGCDSVSSQKIQQWKGTQKGPARLQEALKRASVPPRLRAEAAAALNDIDMADQVDQIWPQIAAAERWEILKSFVPICIEGMKSSDVLKMRAARDSLFAVRGFAQPEEQKQIDAALMPSLEADIRAGRVTGGRHSIDKMLAAMGPSAGPMLVALLSDPKVPYAGTADLLVRVGDDGAREAGGAALVKRAARTPEIPVPMWRAMGALGGKSVLDFLTRKIEGGSQNDAVMAAQALQQRREPSALPLALGVAGHQKVNKAVRDEMFGLVEKIGGPEAQRGLIQIIASDPNDIVRYRAYEAALEVGKDAAVVSALESFPAGASYKKEDVVDFLAKDVTKLGPSGKVAARKCLASGSALARMTGVLALENLGDAADGAAVLKLSADKGTVKGFPAGDTVGKEAARVAALLQKKGG